MKLLFAIDQKALLAAGIEAPHSNQTIDIDVSLISSETRNELMPHYDLSKGSICKKSFSWNDLKVSVPLTEASALAALDSLAEQYRNERIKESERVKKVQEKYAGMAKRSEFYKTWKRLDENNWPGFLDHDYHYDVYTVSVPDNSIGFGEFLTDSELETAKQRATELTEASRLDRIAMLDAKLAAKKAKQEQQEEIRVHDLELIKPLMSANQLERLAAGVLPGSELNALATKHLRGKFAKSKCSVSGDDDEVTSFNEAEWQQIKAAKSAYPDAVVKMMSFTRDERDDDRGISFENYIRVDLSFMCKNFVLYLDPSSFVSKPVKVAK